MIFPIIANSSKIKHATQTPFLITLLYSFEFRDSVKERTIGAVPIGFNRVNNDENDNSIKDKSKLFILHFFRR